MRNKIMHIFYTLLELLWVIIWSRAVFVTGKARWGEHRPLGRCRLQYLQGYWPLWLSAVSYNLPYTVLIVFYRVVNSLTHWNIMVTYRTDTDSFPYYLTSEQELPTPSAVEEKVLQHLNFWVWILNYDVGHLKLFWTKMMDISWFHLTAKASGDRASGEMAEDGEEMGQVQEQWEGELYNSDACPKKICFCCPTIEGPMTSGFESDRFCQIM